jgi:hypothetical protein
MEHGVLRCNDSHNNLSEEGDEGRFKLDDPRRKFIMEKLDPRIHFALNCGAKSCPPVLTYNE